MVLPIVRVQGGVYFMSAIYGTSLVADSVLVLKDAEASHGGSAYFDLGDDVELVDPDENDDDEEDELSDA